MTLPAELQIVALVSCFVIAIESIVVHFIHQLPLFKVKIRNPEFKQGRSIGWLESVRHVLRTLTRPVPYEEQDDDDEDTPVVGKYKKAGGEMQGKGTEMTKRVRGEASCTSPQQSSVEQHRTRGKGPFLPQLDTIPAEDAENNTRSEERKGFWERLATDQYFARRVSYTVDMSVFVAGMICSAIAVGYVFVRARSWER